MNVFSKVWLRNWEKTRAKIYTLIFLIGKKARGPNSVTNTQINQGTSWCQLHSYDQQF